MGTALGALLKWNARMKLTEGSRMIQPTALTTIHAQGRVCCTTARNSDMATRRHHFQASRWRGCNAADRQFRDSMR